MNSANPNNFMNQPLQIFLTGQPAVGKTTIIKHILHELNQTSSTSTITNLSIKGFYTEECRKEGGGSRIGFDIVSYLDNAADTKGPPHIPQRHPLSRIVSKKSIPKNSSPHVGNYLVDIENVEKYAVASLSSHNDDVLSNNASSCSLPRNELVVVDEVGKMEMLCPSFIPAVHRLLDDSLRNHVMNSNYYKRIVLGTLPTPRYGRVIPQVENIRLRHDVIVLHVTKSNRDELKHVLCNVVRTWFAQDSHGQEVTLILNPFIYHGREKLITSQKVSNAGSGVVDHAMDVVVVPCDPLFENNNSSGSSITPKVLVLGESASPKPSDDSYSYCQRSMWTIFGRMFGIEYSPIQNIQTATKEELETFIQLKEKVMANSICIWDVFATVHDKSKTTNRKVKRQKVAKQGAKTNDIIEFLQKHPTIEKIIFIGKKAYASFVRHISLPDSVPVALITVPSSSRANSKLTMDEKVIEWKKALF